MATQRTYKIRKFQNGRNREGRPFINYSLTIPSEIAVELPEDMHFMCEMTDEGILFRPIEARPVQSGLPDWAKSAPKASRPRQRPSGRRARQRPGRRRPAAKAA